MLYGLRDTIQSQYPQRTMLENCKMENIIIDKSTTQLVWGSSVTTAVVITAVHLTRWMVSSPHHVVSELLICLLAVSGVVLFLHDVHRCRIQTGMAKLLILLIVANCVIPWLRYDPVPEEAGECSGVVGEE